ncbi:MAG: GNAT family N-acetyltransferase [Dysgonomonas sp.]|uniref:GNAT family N-acetyltransferase n=1 Tax=Dysgonomonas sp. TaxID=1891233 RepID=UPI003A884F91
MDEILIRPIEEKDNKELAALIRAVFEEFGSEKIGTVYSDPETDALFRYFSKAGAEYWVAEENGSLIGGCGIYPTKGLPDGCAELVKLYLSPSARGKGLGLRLFDKSVKSAIKLGYKQLYLESFPEFSKAVSMYESFGFKQLDHPLGNSGHYACTIYMIKDL